MLGKLIDGRLQIAGRIVKEGNTTITNPTNEKLVELGYKEIVYCDKPNYDKENEKLIEVYAYGDEPHTDKLYASYEKVALTKEEKIEIIKQEIIEEEDKITKRNILDFAVDKDNEALNRIQQHRSIIIELRAKLREITNEE